MNIVEALAGVALLLVALADVFLTILYARMNSGFLAMRLAHGMERSWVWVSHAFGRSRARFLSFCGPVTLLAVLGLWTGLLVLGSALVLHPALGHAVRPSNAVAETDFLTALYVGGASVSVVGSSGYSPETSAYRMFFLFNSAVGITLISVVLAYLAQLYNALHRRNTLALKVHALTAEKGDAAELLCCLWPRGDIASGASPLNDLASEMSAVKEAHHFYPLLMQFRFEEPFYSVSRVTSVSLDAMSLTMSLLDDEHFAVVKESASVAVLWRSSLWLVSSMTNHPPLRRPTAHDVELWRRRYRAALAHVESAGIATEADEERGFERYVNLRSLWDGYVHTLAPVLASSIDEVDPPLSLAEKET